MPARPSLAAGLHGPRSGPVRVTMTGPLFEKRIDREIEREIVEYTMDKIEHRLRRGGRRLGRKNNPIREGRLTLGGGATLEMTSTTNWPRTSGGSWSRKNVAIVKAMAPRVLRATAKRIVTALSPMGS